MLRTRVAVLVVAAALGASLLAYGSTAMAQEDSQEEGPPVVEVTYPADGQSRVERDAWVFVIFSEYMRERSIKGKTVRLYEGDELVPATVSYSDIGRFRNNEARLEPKSRLKPKTKYRVVVEGAADDDGKAVKDLDGTAMAKDYTFSFTTGNK